MKEKILYFFKACIHIADRILLFLLPKTLYYHLFPRGSLFLTMKIHRLQTRGNFIQLSPLHSNDAIPYYRVAYFNGCPDGRSDRYRVYDQVRFLTANNVLADVYSYGSIDELEASNLYDCLVLFRCANGIESQMRRILYRYHAANAPVFYDVDDYLLERCTNDERYAVAETIRCCDRMTVSTKYLADLYYSAFHIPVDVIPITISEIQYDYAQAILKQRQGNNLITGKVRIVYLCGSNSHDRDFLVASDALFHILLQHPEAELVLVGPLKVPKIFKRVKKQVVRVKYMPYLKLLEFTATANINIAPLTNEVFNLGKSETKITEAALLKVPTIASPIYSYEQLITSGVNGIIAKTSQEWYEALERLISDKVFRQQMGEQAHKDFVNMYTLQNVGKKIIDLQLRAMHEN